MKSEDGESCNRDSSPDIESTQHLSGGNAHFSTSNLLIMNSTKQNCRY